MFLSLTCYFTLIVKCSDHIQEGRGELGKRGGRALPLSADGPSSEAERRRTNCVAYCLGFRV